MRRLLVLALACSSQGGTKIEDNREPVIADGSAAVRDAGSASAVVPGLFGAHAGTLGPLLAGFSLGMPNADREKALGRFDPPRDFEVLMHPFAPRLQAIQLTAHGRCEAVEAHLETWSEPRVVEGRAYWVHASAPIRVSYRRRGPRDAGGEDACDVRYEWYVSAEAWIDDAVVPISAIGMSRAQLRDRVAARPYVADVLVDESGVSWSDAGVGLGFDRTKVRASLVNGNVASLHAETWTDPATRAAIEKRLTQRFGAPTTDDSFLIWQRPRVYVYKRDPSALVVGVGARPRL